jgi:trimeric autotransporter adhesin
MENIVAGSGGVSSCAVNSTSTSAPGTCSAGYPKPRWQQAAGIPQGQARDLPDISLMAGDGISSAAWLVCTDDVFTSGGTTYTTNCLNSVDGFGFVGFGGTSASAPAFAGILALVQSKTQLRLGQAAQELYELANGPYSNLIFHDISVGNNSVPCTSGTPDCSMNAANSFFEAGYNASSGYDLATGLGSVDATALVNYWGTATGSAVPTLTITPSATTFPATQSISVTVSVAGDKNIGTPTGRVTIVGGGYDSGSQMLQNGSYQATMNPGDLAVGTDTMTASYSGDPNYAPATSSTTVNVTGPYVSFSPSSLTFPNTIVGTSPAPQTLVVKNTGTDDVIISGISAVEIWGSYKQTNDCGTKLVPGAFCTVAVTFSPNVQISQPGDLEVFDNAVHSPQHAPLYGIAYIPKVAISIDTYFLNFPNTVVGTASPSKLIVVTNTGTAQLSVNNVSFTGTNPNSFSQTNGCASVAVNASCTISVTFNPASYAEQKATLVIASNAPNSPQSVNLAGTGIELGSYVLSASPIALTPGASGTSTITAIPTGGYSGTITLNACSQFSTPAGAVNVPSCVVANSKVAAGAVSANGVVTISCTGSGTNSATRRATPGPIIFGTVGGLLWAALAFSYPAGRCRKNPFLLILLGAFLLSTISACSAGGGSSGGSGPGGNGTAGNSGTTRGSYVFTVSGIDFAGVAQVTTIAVTVN